MTKFKCQMNVKVQRSLKFSFDIPLRDPPFSYDIMNGLGLPQESLHFTKRNHAGGITEGPLRLRMGFKEEAVAADCDRGSYEMRNKLRTSSPRILAGDAVISDNMSRIEDNRTTHRLHDGNGTVVRDQFIIPETGPALC